MSNLQNVIFSLQASENNRVAAFVDKLISKLGIARIIAGIPSSSEMMTCHSRYPRAWLAVEMLCTWKWQGGSALTSFLPSLVEYTKNQDSDNLFDPIVKILLDGALVQGENSKTVLPSIYPAPHDEPESIEQVFLRPLVSVLGTLFEDNIWGRDKALGIFNLLLDRLFVGEAINTSCLNILPVVNSVLIGPLSSQVESLEEDQIHDVIEGWLQRTLSFPPLNTWLSGDGK